MTGLPVATYSHLKTVGHVLPFTANAKRFSCLPSCLLVSRAGARERRRTASTSGRSRTRYRGNLHGSRPRTSQRLGSSFAVLLLRRRRVVLLQPRNPLA